MGLAPEVLRTVCPERGLWSDARASLTNVVKLYANLAGTPLPDTLALRDEDERILTDPAAKPLQVAGYLRDVGDSSDPLVNILGGVFGTGVVARIVRGYTFISRHYEPGVVQRCSLPMWAASR